MFANNKREVEHETTVRAPAHEVYRLVEDVTGWPHIFSPTVHVEYIEKREGRERIRFWATANDTAKTWTSRRELSPGSLRIDFRQEVSAPPVGGMGGAWIITPVSETESQVRLLHDYYAASGSAEDLEWIDKAVDRNSRVELDALKDHAEHGADRTFTFADTVEIHGDREDAYDFVNEAARWQERLPHVARVDLQEPSPGLQLLEMDTRTKDGSTHTTKSVRVCEPNESIVYKQIRLPLLMTLHTGRWDFEKTALGRARATSRHTVRINEDRIPDVLGDGATLSDAREYVRKALSANSMATLRLAKEYAEERV